MTADVTDRPIDAEALARLVARDHAGALVTFAGVVRDHDHGSSVDHLEYSAHPSAAALMRQIAEEVVADFGLDALAVTHRVGRLEVGDCALAAAVSSAHRAEAFAATAALVDRVKQRVPVWKRQVFADGTSQWVNSP
ncbi:molybdenum cofactor biosynthesis protein MoaE [Isoptericola sp. b441]|uniref:Molybdenum cofactor biosynthesis protein MoaE n=1 Tax=Actinotalea lenta TaxID=3064654 RepID=A0ABT9DBX1_9CELL|nr:molybdenum cofactor biosynthesis protein MoaE [Isoptericola sp. b441]MDO8108377.1 molybdenum cofactor biosynthesis protein MoaE [Isoptericola sp. b441]